MPGVEEPLRMRGEITWSAGPDDEIEEGQSRGMRVEFDTDDHVGRQSFEAAIEQLSAEVAG